MPWERFHPEACVYLGQFFFWLTLEVVCVCVIVCVYLFITNLFFYWLRRWWHILWAWILLCACVTYFPAISLFLSVLSGGTAAIWTGLIATAEITATFPPLGVSISLLFSLFPPLSVCHFFSLYVQLFHCVPSFPAAFLPALSGYIDFFTLDLLPLLSISVLKWIPVNCQTQAVLLMEFVNCCFSRYLNWILSTLHLVFCKRIFKHLRTHLKTIYYLLIFLLFSVASSICAKVTRGKNYKRKKFLKECFV